LGSKQLHKVRKLTQNDEEKTINLLKIKFNVILLTNGWKHIFKWVAWGENKKFNSEKKGNDELNQSQDWFNKWRKSLSFQKRSR